jgi:hypothetical protein
MIRIKNAEVILTEQTVRSLVKAIEKAKKETEFIIEPTSEKKFECDMTPEQFDLKQKRKGTIRVKSEYSKIEYIIHLEVKPHTQESLGYKLV